VPLHSGVATSFKVEGTSARQKTMENCFHQAICFNNGPNTNGVA